MQERRQHATRRILILAASHAARGGVAPRHKNITTKDTGEAKKKQRTSRQGDKKQTENNKTEDKTKRKGKTENGRRERKNKVGRRKTARKGVRAVLCSLLGSQPGGRIMTMMAIPKRQSVGQTACSPCSVYCSAYMAPKRYVAIVVYPRIGPVHFFFSSFRSIYYLRPSILSPSLS